MSTPGSAQSALFWWLARLLSACYSECASKLRLLKPAYQYLPPWLGIERDQPTRGTKRSSHASRRGVRCSRPRGAKPACPPFRRIQRLHHNHVGSGDALQHQLCNAITSLDCANDTPSHKHGNESGESSNKTIHRWDCRSMDSPRTCTRAEPGSRQQQLSRPHVPLLPYRPLKAAPDAIESNDPAGAASDVLLTSSSVKLKSRTRSSPR